MANGFVLTLIRHLPTAGNQERKYIGWTDEPILESDEWEWKLCGCLSPLQFVYGSDLLRSRQSATLYFPKATFEADADWRECNFGEFEGKTFAELEKNKVYRNWIDNPYEISPPGGESLRDVETRVLAALRRLPNEAVVVTHGGPIRTILSKLSSEEKAFWSWDIPHGTGYRLEWESEKAFKEGKPCTFLSAVPTTANGNT
ncbi:MAG: histidine phosphatase family protein [Sporosarcina sp.]